MSSRSFSFRTSNRKHLPRNSFSQPLTRSRNKGTNTVSAQKPQSATPVTNTAPPTQSRRKYCCTISPELIPAADEYFKLREELAVYHTLEELGEFFTLKNRCEILALETALEKNLYRAHVETCQSCTENSDKVVTQMVAVGRYSDAT